MSNLVPYDTDDNLETLKLAVRTITPLVTVYGNTVIADVLGTTNMPGAVTCYVATGSQPTPSDAGANFGTLVSNADPSVIGILVNTTSAIRIVDISVPALGISSAPMTAGVIALKGASTTGVTNSGNIAFTISCTGLKLDDAVTITQFPVIIKYFPSGNVLL